MFFTVACPRGWATGFSFDLLFIFVIWVAAVPPLTGLVFKTSYIMKEFFRIMAKDFLKEDFSKREWLVYGVVVPCAMIAWCLIASYIDTL